MFRKRMVLSLLASALLLSGCRLETDAVVVQDLPSGDQKCWIIYDRLIWTTSAGEVRWARAGDGDEYRIFGNTTVRYASGKNGKFGDLKNILAEMQVRDPSKCVTLR